MDRNDRIAALIRGIEHNDPEAIAALRRVRRKNRPLIFCRLVARWGTQIEQAAKLGVSRGMLGHVWYGRVRAIRGRAAGVVRWYEEHGVPYRAFYPE